MNVDVKVCSKCKESKSTVEFCKNKSTKDGLNYQCNLCSRANGHERWKKNPQYRTEKLQAFKKRRETIQAKVLEFLSVRQCIDCPENDPVALEFDHIGDKQYTISEMVVRGFGWEKVEQEIQKCVVRCANCHRKKTARERGYYRTIKPA